MGYAHCIRFKEWNMIKSTANECVSVECQLKSHECKCLHGCIHVLYVTHIQTHTPKAVEWGENYIMSVWFSDPWLVTFQTAILRSIDQCRQLNLGLMISDYCLTPRHKTKPVMLHLTPPMVPFHFLKCYFKSIGWFFKGLNLTRTNNMENRNTFQDTSS